MCAIRDAPSISGQVLIRTKIFGVEFLSGLRFLRSIFKVQIYGVEFL